MNDHFVGTLGVNIDRRTRDHHASWARSSTRLLAELRYGTIAVNAWTARRLPHRHRDLGRVPRPHPRRRAERHRRRAQRLPIDRHRAHGGAWTVPARRRGRSCTASGRISPKPPWFVTNRTAAHHRAPADGDSPAAPSLEATAGDLRLRPARLRAAKPRSSVVEVEPNDDTATDCADYVVVGTGSAGAVLANRLSADSAQRGRRPRGRREGQGQVHPHPRRVLEAVPQRVRLGLPDRAAAGTRRAAASTGPAARCSAARRR